MSPPKHYSDTYPAANRPETAWPYSRTDIYVQSASGITLFNMNTLAFAGHDNTLRHLAPLADKRSDISGEAAVVIGFHDVKLALTPGELERLARTTLSAEEFFALAKKYGLFYLISPHYYDEDTGESLEVRNAHQEEMSSLMADGTLVLTPVEEGRIHVAFEDGPVMHEGIVAHPGELRFLLENLGYTVALPGSPCWSCGKPVTEEQRAENDGFCPHCMAELSEDD